jgi:hypothetical protein
VARVHVPADAQRPFRMLEWVGRRRTARHGTARQLCTQLVLPNGDVRYHYYAANTSRDGLA